MLSGFHSKWNRFVGTKHPSIWIFIWKLKDEERSERRRIRTVREGQVGPKMRRKWRKIEKKIKKLKREYRRGFRNADEYWNAMTYVVKSFNCQENDSMFVLYLRFRFNKNPMLSDTHLNSSSQLSSCLDHFSQNLLSCWRWELGHTIFSHTFPEFIMFILSTAIYDDSGESGKTTMIQCWSSINKGLIDHHSKLNW